jgi:hypothetical protein
MTARAGMAFGPDYIFTMSYNCMIVRRSVTNRHGMYRVIVHGFASRFMDSFDAVIDDFGNLVRIPS